MFLAKKTWGEKKKINPFTSNAATWQNKPQMSHRLINRIRVTSPSESGLSPEPRRQTTFFYYYEY